MASIDHRSFRSSADPSISGLAAGPGHAWWTLTGEEAAQSVSATLDLLRNAQELRLTQLTACARLYGNLPVTATPAMLQRMAAVMPAIRERISYNAIQIGVDTVVAKIRRNRPRPYFLTSGGNITQQRRAKKLNKFIEGVFYGGKVQELAPEVFRDGCVWGTGAVHVFGRNRRVRFERVLPQELWVDEVEAENRSPRSMHRVKPVDRRVLIGEWPEFAEQIERAASAPVEPGTQDTISDLVLLRESWRLPSSPEADDGRHLITVEGCELLNEPWTREHFPFAFFHWSRRLFGFWAQGAVEQQMNNQLDLNKTRWAIFRGLHLMGGYKVLMDTGSKIVSEHLNNDIGAVVKYSGTPPQYIVPQAVPPELYARERALISDILEGIGVNQLAARSAKPAGLNSGAAIREYRDESEGRLATPGEHYEQFHLEMAKLAIEAIKEIVADNSEYEVAVPGKKFLQSVKWNDVHLEEDQYTLRCFPVSSLPSDPAGRLQTVQELAQAGFLTQRQANRLMNFPDLEQVESLQTAQEDWQSEVLDGIADEGRYTPPDPHADLALAAEMALEYYARGQVEGLEEERLDMLRTYISQVRVLVESMQPPQPTANNPAVAAGAAPLAAPEPPPVSDLIPNAA